MTVYLLQLQSGEYSDYTHEEFGFCFKEEIALQHQERLNRAINAFKEAYRVDYEEEGPHRDALEAELPEEFRGEAFRSWLYTGDGAEVVVVELEELK